MSNHTTGEWKLNKKNGRIVECDGNKILTASATPWDKPEAWANARLAKAAPELLRLLKEVFEDGLKTNMQSWRKAANAAIAEAEGSQ